MKKYNARVYLEFVYDGIEIEAKDYEDAIDQLMDTTIYSIEEEGLLERARITGHIITEVDGI